MPSSDQILMYLFRHMQEDGIQGEHFFVGYQLMRYQTAHLQGERLYEEFAGENKNRKTCSEYEVQCWSRILMISIVCLPWRKNTGKNARRKMLCIHFIANISGPNWAIYRINLHKKLGRSVNTLYNVSCADSKNLYDICHGAYW